MIRLNTFQSLLAGAACALALGGCASFGIEAEGQGTLAHMMREAADAARDGKAQRAQALLLDAAAAYPTNKAPWLQKARLEFEDGKYAEAILDAQQALARDPNEQIALSLVAVSSLRLSTTALGELAKRTKLRSGSPEMAKLLRDNIGESALVPAKPRPAGRPGHNPVGHDASDGADLTGGLK